MVECELALHFLSQLLSAINQSSDLPKKCRVQDTCLVLWRLSSFQWSDFALCSPPCASHLTGTSASPEATSATSAGDGRVKSFFRCRGRGTHCESSSSTLSMSFGSPLGIPRRFSCCRSKNEQLSWRLKRLFSDSFTSWPKIQRSWWCRSEIACSYQMSLGWTSFNILLQFDLRHQESLILCASGLPPLSFRRRSIPMVIPLPELTAQLRCSTTATASPCLASASLPRWGQGANKPRSHVPHRAARCRTYLGLKCRKLRISASEKCGNFGAFSPGPLKLYQSSLDLN